MTTNDAASLRARFDFRSDADGDLHLCTDDPSAADWSVEIGRHGECTQLEPECDGPAFPGLNFATRAVNFLVGHAMERCHLRVSDGSATWQQGDCEHARSSVPASHDR